jgi:hypothetical protein
LASSLWLIWLVYVGYLGSFMLVCIGYAIFEKKNWVGNWRMNEELSDIYISKQPFKTRIIP